MKVTIEPSIAYGGVTAPPSKSMAHRLLICAALAGGQSTLKNVSFSEDIKATKDCIEALGALVQKQKDKMIVSGIGKDQILGVTDFYCNESGSTIRFFIPVAMILCKEARFYGSSRLLERPFSVYEDIALADGIVFKKEKDHIYVSGKLRSSEYTVPGDISSQFITGLIFALSLTGKRSRIHITGKIESRSYIDLTIKALEYFGKKVTFEGNEITVEKGELKPCDLRVEGDYSNAAFLDALNLTDGNVTVRGLLKGSLQGDRIYKHYYEILSTVQKPSLDISDCPDLGPVLLALMALKGGGTLTGTARLKIKESDRGVAMAEELSKFGISVKVNEDTIEVLKGTLKRPATVLNGHNDHRIVMSLVTLLTVTGGTIAGAEAVKKSFPDYFTRLKRLHVKVEYNGMDK